MSSKLRCVNKKRQVLHKIVYKRKTNESNESIDSQSPSSEQETRKHSHGGNVFKIESSQLGLGVETPLRGVVFFEVRGCKRRGA